MRTLLALLLFLAACAPAPPPQLATAAPAQIAPTCPRGTLDATVRDILAAVPGVKAIRLTGARAQRFMAAFNAAPPPSDIKADEVALLRRGEEPAVLLILAIRGCVTDMAPMSYEQVRAWAAGMQIGERRA